MSTVTVTTRRYKEHLNNNPSQFNQIVRTSEVHSKLLDFIEPELRVNANLDIWAEKERIWQFSCCDCLFDSHQSDRCEDASNRLQVGVQSSHFLDGNINTK